MDKVPRHMAVVMDGSRRWTKEKGLSGFEGHIKGAEKVRKVVRWCGNRGIKFLTLYGFSTENWDRPQKEVSFLMRLGGIFLDKEIKELHQEGAKLLVIGQRERLSVLLQRKIKEAEDLTRENDRFTLIMAISYGGRAEIAMAVKKMIEEKISSDNVTEEIIGRHLYTTDLPDPDFIIRTGGEQRTSGFLMWQSPYSEWYFTKIYWPDFSENDLDEALAEYSRRQRRFGR